MLYQIKQRISLMSLSDLSHSEMFKASLIWARDNPLSLEDKVLNARLFRVLSMVGATVPYSPFERSTMRSKMLAHRYRYGSATFFNTGSPPEFEDPLILRSCCIKKHNDPKCPISSSAFRRCNLPEYVRSNTSIRLRLTKERPLLCALHFHLKLDALLDGIVGCSATSKTRRSYDYLQHKRLGFGPISSINGVIEPQADGRLHWHINLLSGVLNPPTLTLLAAAPSILKTRLASFLDSIVCTSNPAYLYEWWQNDENKMTRAADLEVPDVTANYTGFMDIARKKAILMGMHGHGFTCQKLPKGRYQCRLSMPRGIHAKHTCPLLIKRLTHHNAKLDQRAQFQIDDEYTGKEMLAQVDLNVELCHPHRKGTIIWEQHRDEKDKYFVEQNLLITNLIQCHNNTSVISGRDSGEAVEEYLTKYLEKEASSLKQAAGVLLAAIEHI